MANYFVPMTSEGCRNRSSYFDFHESKGAQLGSVGQILEFGERKKE
jgi:hypothetical protein